MADLDSLAEQPKPPVQQPDDEVAAKANPDSAKPPRVLPPKKIFVFCDGTGNEFRTQDPSIKDTDGNSNVVKLYTALDLNPSQIAYYHPGVGTVGDPSKKGLVRFWEKTKGLAFGWGFEADVLDAYRYLMQHYNAGDQVYLFGFSRGSYVARALAGFLHGYGLLCRGNEGHILYAWSMYTAKLKKRHTQNAPTVETDFAFRDTFSHPDFMMHFVGLWDTVSAVGWITTPLRLLHLAQNPSIVIGRHAVSVYERRCFYHDNLWGDPVQVQVPPVLKGTPRGDALNRLQDIKQVWFPGVHSDVGGSYGQYSSGLANDALQWMMDELNAVGVKFKSSRQQAVIGIRPVTGDPNGETTELQRLYPKPTSWDIHKSLKGWWWILESFPHRYYNTDADKTEILRIPWGAWRRLPDKAILLPSLTEKLADGVTYKYNPPNLACGTREPVTEGPNAGYFTFNAPPPKSDWRENLLVVFAVKTLLTAIPVLLLRRTVLRPWLHALLIETPADVSRPTEWLRSTTLHPGWFASADSTLHHFGADILWSLAAAAIIVIFWTLVRFIHPRQ
jgi:uncharacterized protein (DUF2235 family)